MTSRSDRAALRVLVLGDDPLARGGIAAMLAAEPGLVVVGQFAPRDAGGAGTLRPQVAVWDVGPAGAGALDPLEGDPGYPVLALVPDAVRAREALGAGTRGALRRDAGAGRIAAALRALGAELMVLDAGLASLLLRPAPVAAASPLDALTPREIEVLQLLARGLANRQIATALGISEHTAKFHVNAILGKLAAATRTEAVVLAARLGLVVL